MRSREEIRRSIHAPMAHDQQEQLLHAILEVLLDIREQQTYAMSRTVTNVEPSRMVVERFGA